MIAHTLKIYLFNQEGGKYEESSREKDDCQRNGSFV